MNATTQINQRLKLLPVELQKEVLQFIDYLLFKEKSAESKTKGESALPTPLEPSSFSWAGALKGMDEGLTSVEWQHKINLIDYREFWGIIQPPMGIEKIDQLISST